MKFSPRNKAAYALAVAFLLPIAVRADSKEIRTKNEFVNYCGTGSRYKSCDDIILTANIELTSDITLRKNLRIRSQNGKTYTISVANARQFAIDPSYKLTLTNIVFDGKDYTRRNEGLFYLNPSPSASTDTNNIARLELQAGTTIKNVTVTTTADADHAVIHAKRGSRLIMWDGAAILNCHNKSAHGNGGAICCDSGNIIMNGGTIAGCTALGSGGAIRVTGARTDADDHLGVAMRGDIFLYGGYITNNVCGEGSAYGAECYGGGIYLGDTGPMLHVIGPVVISNNICKIKKTNPSRDQTYESIPDDVSTYLLQDEYANRLKLSGDEKGFVFTDGWVGVRYPDRRKMKDQENYDEEMKDKRFGGVWEYVTTSHEESRQFFWNGDNRYRGWINGNALVWTRHKIYQLPLDRTTVKDVLLAADTNFPIFIEFNDGFIMNKDALDDSHIRVPDGLHVTFDLQGHSITCNLEVANGGSVTFRDSSTNRSGRVWGYRDVASDIVKDSPAYTNAYRIEGGSYRTEPDPAWVAPDCVVVGNYCEVHKYMVARLAWETNLASRVADVTCVPLETVDHEIREVAYDAEDGFDLDEITYSTGDWVLNAHTNSSRHVRVLAAPAVSNAVTGVLEETGPRVVYFDTAVRGGIVNGENVTLPEHDANDLIPALTADANGSGGVFGREDTFIWNAQTYGLIKLIHITYTKSGALEITNATEQAYFRFPDAAFKATQRKTGGRLPILLSDALLAEQFNINRADGLSDEGVNGRLDAEQPNGLKRWENLVTGTAENQLLLSTAKESAGGLNLRVALSDAEKTACANTGYSVWYEIRRSTSEGWTRVGNVSTAPVFDIPLLDASGASKNAAGFYRVTTLIVPDHTPSVTNEIPSTNIVGVLEIAGALTNTLAAVPWVSLASDPTTADGTPVTVSNYVHTALIHDSDMIQVADQGLIYRQWHWDTSGQKWHGATTVTPTALVAAEEAHRHSLARHEAVWITRNDPTARPIFLIGQYSGTPVTCPIAAAGDRETCTLVPNPSLEARKINDYPWGDHPSEKDQIRLPNEKEAPHVLRWKNGEWGRILPVPGSRDGVWETDFTVPAGTGFWYMRKEGGAFNVTLPQSVPSAQ